MAVTAHVVDLEQIERLADKVKGLIGVLERTRQELNRTVDDNAKLQQEIEGLRAQLATAESSNADLSSLLSEREQIRDRVQNMLEQLEAINV